VTFEELMFDICSINELHSADYYAKCKKITNTEIEDIIARQECNERKVVL
jgi:hypothetical protein